jgi:chemotaxis receptor (MCP) glutamine deamidase CheD/CheY-like chemotaxis protein
VPERRVFLLPGEYAFEQKPALISTLLGSCVAVCLYDARRCWSGVNHYMLPVQGDGDLSPGKYGDFAIPALLKLFAKAGSARQDLTASVFGGGKVAGHLGSVDASSQSDVGDKNIALADRLLREHGIPVTRREVGGRTGRKIHVHSATNEVQVRTVNPLASHQDRAARREALAKRKVRVLIIDDSRAVRALLRKGVELAEDMEVVGEAADPYEARGLILETDPDVLCLDIIMPNMDGHTFLRKLMRYKPIPAVVISTIAQRGSVMREKVLEAGAVDVIDKEELALYQGMRRVTAVLHPKLRTAAATVVRRRT